MSEPIAFPLYFALTVIACYAVVIFVVWHSRHPGTGVRIVLTVVVALAFLGTAVLFAVPVLRGGSRA